MTFGGGVSEKVVRARRRRQRWRKFKRDQLPVLLLPIGCLWGLLLSPFAFVSLAADERKKNATAERQRCIDCGRPLDSAAVELGHKQWRAYLDRLHELLNAISVNIKECGLHAVCTHCGCAYQYLEREDRFHKVAMPDAAEDAKPWLEDIERRRQRHSEE
jgi:hypothetical protein